MTLTSSWQTATSTWPTVTSQSARTPQEPTPAAVQPSQAPRLTTWTESWRMGITSWWWGARAWCCPWTTQSRPSQTLTTAWGCEDSVFGADPGNRPTHTVPSHRAKDQYLSLLLSSSRWFLFCSCTSSLCLFFLSTFPSQLHSPTSYAGKSLSLPHSAHFHTFLANCNIVLFICRFSFFPFWAFIWKSISLSLA